MDRGFTSTANRRYLQRGGGHYIVGEKLRGESAEAAAALSRQGRYHTVTGNLRVKEVSVNDGTARDRFVICHNPETATRDAAVREQIIARLTEAIAGTDTLTSAKRAELAGRLKTKPAFARFLRSTPTGKLRIDRAKVTAEAHLDGKFLLRTSDEPCPPPTSPKATRACTTSSEAGATSNPPSTCARSTTTARTASAATPTPMARAAAPTRGRNQHRTHLGQHHPRRTGTAAPGHPGHRRGPSRPT